jgi:outer membrane biosynthesis protein TonB
MIITLFFSLALLTPATALATPAPDAYAQAPEPDEAPGNKVAPAPKAPDAEKVEAKVVPPMEQPEDAVEAIKDVGVLVEAARNGNWVLFTGILIMLLIFVLDKIVKLKDRLPANAVPWVAASLGILGSIAAQLTTGIPWGQALLQGFTAGVAAVGLWELVFKAMLKKKKPEPVVEDEKPEEEEPEADDDTAPEPDPTPESDSAPEAEEDSKDEPEAEVKTEA